MQRGKPSLECIDVSERELAVVEQLDDAQNVKCPAKG
jgi:hypothetical protein